jgi:hypothetical protein
VRQTVIKEKPGIRHLDPEINPRGWAQGRGPKLLFWMLF